jgi:hypothetical protein
MTQTKVQVIGNIPTFRRTIYVTYIETIISCGRRGYRGIGDLEIIRTSG